LDNLCLSCIVQSISEYSTASQERRVYVSTVIIACKTLENELRRAIEVCGCNHDVLWIESGLHNVPKKLTQKLQEVLDSCQSYSRVLLAMGYCGNSLAGLCSSGAALIIPRVDDCISLLLGSYERRRSLPHTTYYMTEGWLRGERSIWKEYEYAVEKYGEETAKSILDMMLGQYKQLAMLDTGCFDAAAIERELLHIASELGLEYTVVPATIDYLVKLLTGPWDGVEFLTIPPFAVIKDNDLTLSGN